MREFLRTRSREPLALLADAFCSQAFAHFALDRFTILRCKTAGSNVIICNGRNGSQRCEALLAALQRVDSLLNIDRN